MSDFDELDEIPDHKRPITLQLRDSVRRDLSSLRMSTSGTLNRWIAEYALPRFARYERRRQRRWEKKMRSLRD